VSHLSALATNVEVKQSLIPNTMDHQRIISEMHSIIEVIEQLSGLPSNWNGKVILDVSLRERGTKPFSCEIVLRADLVSEASRWRTLIHEGFHSVSAGYLPLDFIAHRGWEEGLVEQAQRIMRSEILRKIGIEVDPAAFEEVERNHLFNEYVDALERIRNGFGSESRDFYIDLLKTPIKQRYSSLQARAMLLQGDRRIDMVRLLAEANVVLTRRMSL
jgi:hypothetical protein